MKKTIYIISAVFLGALLSLLAHAILEMAYLKTAELNGWYVALYDLPGSAACAAPLWLNIAFILLGAVGGYFLGQCWWRAVYIEKRHWRFKKEQLDKK